MFIMAEALSSHYQYDISTAVYLRVSIINTGSGEMKMHLWLSQHKEILIQRCVIFSLFNSKGTAYMNYMNYIMCKNKGIPFFYMHNSSNHN